MNADLKSAQDDLAYLKGLVQGGGQRQRAAGQLFLIGGVLYSAQCFYHWADAAHVIHPPGVVTLAVCVVITALFLGALAWSVWTNRKVSAGGAAARTVNTAFAALGSTNFVMICIFGSVAYSQRNFIIWLLYPCVVAALQGTAWMVSALINRRLWYGGVSLGWFITAIAMALTIGSHVFVGLIAFGLLIFMALPGLILMRQAPKAD